VSWAIGDADSTKWDPSGPNPANLQGLLAVALPCNFSGVALEGPGLTVYLTPLDDHTRSVADAILSRYLPQVKELGTDSYILKEGKQSWAQAEVQMAEIGKRHQRCVGWSQEPDGSVEIGHGCWKPD